MKRENAEPDDTVSGGRINMQMTGRTSRRIVTANDVSLAKRLPGE